MISADSTSQSRPRLYALDLFRGGVHRIDLDSGTITDLVLGMTEAPDGIIVDEKEGFAYFTLMGTPDTPLQPSVEPPFEARNGSVQRVSLEGGDPEIVVDRGAFITGKQITTDRTTGRLYWTDREGSGVYSANRDGTDMQALVLTAGHGPSRAEEQCIGVAVDPARGWLYWSQKGPSDGNKGRILRSHLVLPEGATAASRTDIEVLWSGLPEPIDLELEPAGGVLYWTDRGAPPLGNSLNFAPVPDEGAPAEAPTVLATGFKEAIGLALDLPRHRVFVSDLSGAIYEVEIPSGNKRVIAQLPGAATGLALTS